jgi:hypothetical protein
MDAAEARRSSSASSSPEFEFWPLHPNPAASPSCADELFAGGVLLPLPVLTPKPASSNIGSGISQCVPVAEPEREPEPGEAFLLATVSPPPASITSTALPTATGGGGSKRWTDIFSKKPAPGAEEKDRDKEREKRKDGAGSRKQGGHSHSSGAGSELNINIWPFSRSRSAGGGSVSGSGTSKPRPPARKVSSAPCSRSNSRGEAGAPPLRRWVASPGRSGGGGVAVGRSSPVWQIRRPAAKPAPVPTSAPSASEPFTDRRAPPPRHKEKPASAARKPGLGSGVRGLNLSVNSCIGYRHQVSCRRADVGAARGGGGLFGIKGLFSKKVH